MGIEDAYLTELLLHVDLKYVKNTKDKFSFYYFLANCMIMNLSFLIC